MNKDELIELLLVERYAPRPKPEPVNADTPENVARRRQVLEDLVAACPNSRCKS